MKVCRAKEERTTRDRKGRPKVMNGCRRRVEIKGEGLRGREENVGMGAGGASAVNGDEAFR